MEAVNSANEKVQPRGEVTELVKLTRSLLNALAANEARLLPGLPSDVITPFIIWSNSQCRDKVCCPFLEWLPEGDDEGGVIAEEKIAPTAPVAREDEGFLVLHTCPTLSSSRWGQLGYLVHFQATDEINAANGSEESKACTHVHTGDVYTDQKVECVCGRCRRRRAAHVRWHTEVKKNIVMMDINALNACLYSLIKHCFSIIINIIMINMICLKKRKRSP